jgi:uridine kinase
VINKPCIIGISGASCTGKSRLAHSVANYLTGDPSQVISLDSYYNDLSHLTLAERKKKNFDHPNSLDWDLISQHIRMLSNGRNVDMPTYDFKTHTRLEKTVLFMPSDFVIIEGILAFCHENVTARYNLKVFIMLRETECLSRRIERDQKERGRRINSVISQYHKTVRPMYLEYAYPTRAFADLIVSGNEAVEQTTEFICSHLKKNVRKF